MSTTTFRIGLRSWESRQPVIMLSMRPCSRTSFVTAQHTHLSSIVSSQMKRKPMSETSSKAKTSSYVLTISSSPCTSRQASTTATSAMRAIPTQSSSNTILDWNSFFRLRTSRRRYTLASSIVSSIGVTGAMFVFLSTQPEMADELTRLIPTDQVVSMGILTFSATFLGWLIGPIFGNAVWKVFHRSRLPEFTIKEKAFFERIRRHRVNPMGASTNNPVPDYYGEKIGSVSGYRRWLKDQRAFNRKREGVYRGGI